MYNFSRMLLGRRKSRSKAVQPETEPWGFILIRQSLSAPKNEDSKSAGDCLSPAEVQSWLRARKQAWACDWEAGGLGPFSSVLGTGQARELLPTLLNVCLLLSSLLMEIHRANRTGSCRNRSQRPHSGPRGKSSRLVVRQGGASFCSSQRARGRSSAPGP